MAKCHFDQVSNNVPVGVITDLQNNILISNLAKDASTNYAKTSGEWLVSGARAMITRFWASSTASIVIVPHMPSIYNTCPPLPEGIGIEREFCLWLGYIETIRRVTVKDLQDGRLLKVFVGVVDNIKSTASAKGGYTIQIQARDRVKWLMDSDVYYSVHEISKVYKSSMGTDQMGVPRSLLVHDICRRAVGGPPQDTTDIGLDAETYVSKRRIELDQEQSEDISLTDNAQVDPFKFYKVKDAPLKSQLNTFTPVESNPKLRVITTRIAIGGEYDKSYDPITQYAGLAFLLSGQVALDIVKSIAMQEVYPTEFFQDHRDGNLYYVPRTNDSSGLQDPERFYRTYFFKSPYKNTSTFDEIVPQATSFVSFNSTENNTNTETNEKEEDESPPPSPTWDITISEASKSTDSYTQFDVFYGYGFGIKSKYEGYTKMGSPTYLQVKNGLNLTPEQLLSIDDKLADARGTEDEYIGVTVTTSQSQTPQPPTTASTDSTNSVTFNQMGVSYDSHTQFDIFVKINSDDTSYAGYTKVSYYYIKDGITLTKEQEDKFFEIYKNAPTPDQNKLATAILGTTVNIIQPPTNLPEPPSPTTSTTSSTTTSEEQTITGEKNKALFISTNQNLIAYREEFSSIGMKTNFLVSVSSPMSTAVPHDDLILHLSTNPYSLRDVDFAPKYHRISDPTIKTAEEAAVVAIAAARIWAKETNVAMSVMLGDPSLVPGEIIQTIGSPIIEEGGAKRINKDREKYFEWELNTNQMIREYSIFSSTTAKQRAQDPKAQPTPPSGLKYIIKTAEGVIKAIANDNSFWEVKIRPQEEDTEGNGWFGWWPWKGEVEEDPTKSIEDLFTEEGITSHYGAENQGKDPEGPRGFEELPRTIFRVEAVSHKFNLGSPGYTTEVALVSPF